MNLSIRYVSQGQTLKQWKISPKQKWVVMGHSKKADIYFPSAPEPVLLGFEYDKGSWKLLNLTGYLGNDWAEKPIVSAETLSFKHGYLELSVHSRASWVESSLAMTQVEPAKPEHLRVLVARISQGKVLNTECYSLENFKKSFPVAQKAESYWQTLVGEANEKILYKLSTLDPTYKAWLKEPKSQESSWKLVQGSFWIALLLGMFFYWALPEEKNSKEMALSQTPPPYERSSMTEIRLGKPQASSLTQAESASVESMAKPAASMAKAAGTSHVTSKSSRLSRLIGRLGSSSNLDKVVRLESSQEIGSVQVGGNLKSLGGLQGVEGNSGNQGGSKTIGQIQGALGQGAGRGVSSVLASAHGQGGQSAVRSLEKEAQVDGGGLDPEEIAAVIKKHLGEILYCYERQLSIQPNLYGKVAVKFIIGPRGTVESNRVVQSTLSSASVENCIQSKLSRWQFPQPRGVNQVVVTYPFLFKNAE